MNVLFKKIQLLLGY